ncbi:MAG: FHA domain-containing protein [Planctomycetota bacterium]
MASIIIMSGSKNDYYTLAQTTIVLGRSESLPVQIIDEYISRKHLQIRFDKNSARYAALDLDSKHGAFLNDRKMTQETTLADGDQIRIGDTNILFTDQDFTTREDAIAHFKKHGERTRPTAID